ncbi:MAG: DUF4162 domain-containing protein [Acidimicrobiales bacterium]
MAQRIAVIDRGLVIAEGTSAELKAQLGSTVVELSFADRDARLLAATALAGLGPADAPSASALQLTTTNGPALLGEALRVLTAEGIEPTAIAVREPSLDDVFLALTGHTAEERP